MLTRLLLTYALTRRRFLRLLLALPLVATPGLSAPPASGIVSPMNLTFYVSPTGNDAWSGRLPEPAADGRDGPLASLARARDLLREARRAQPAVPAAVLLRGGDYVLEEPLVLGSDDGGTDEAGVTWAAFEQEAPRLDAGRRIDGWVRTEDALPGLPAAAAGKIWRADVTPGWRFHRLFWDDRELPRSASVAAADWRRWPVCQPGANPDEEVTVPPEALPPAGDGGSADLNFLPTPYTRWANALTRVRVIDRAAGVIRYVPVRIQRPDKLKDIPFRLENLAAGLRAPGNWYLDSDRGRLYLWPPEGRAPDGHTVLAPFLTEAVRVAGDPESGRPVRNLTLRGLAVRRTREARSETQAGFDALSAALALNGLEACRIEAMTFSETEGWAIRGGPEVREVVIRGCLISGGDAGGISLFGKPSAGAFPCADNRVEDNIVRDCGRRFWHAAGISLGAAARTLISHNLVHDMPYVGIACGGGPRHTYFRGWPRPNPELEALWREHGAGAPTIDTVKRFIPGHNRIEKNVIHHVMKVLDDGAAIYCHAGHHEEVLHNVVHAVMGKGSMGLYFDDEQMDSLMEGNLVYRCPEKETPGSHTAAIHFHHNGRNRLVNNVVIGGSQLLSIPNGYGGHLLERNVFVWRGEPNWNRADPRPAKGAGDGRRQAGWDAGPSLARANLWWHADGAAAAQRLLDAWQARGYGQGSVTADPLFRDPANDDYRLRDDSPAFGLGIRPLETGDAGPRP